MLEVIESKEITNTITNKDDWKDIIEKMINK
jgi:hypothetical protein